MTSAKMAFFAATKCWKIQQKVSARFPSYPQGRFILDPKFYDLTPQPPSLPLPNPLHLSPSLSTSPYPLHLSLTLSYEERDLVSLTGLFISREGANGLPQPPFLRAGPFRSKILRSLNL
jgi:hypothetical protein